MPAISTSAAQLTGGNAGSIVIEVSDSAGGGDPTSYDVSVVVSIQNTGYVFSGGLPPVTSTFGVNGARWDRVTFDTGETVTLVYNFTKSVNASSDYVVVVINEATDEFHTHWGTILGFSSP